MDPLQELLALLVLVYLQRLLVVNNKAETEGILQGRTCYFSWPTIPASTMFTHSPVAALKPVPSSTFFNLSTITDPSCQPVQRFDELVLSKARTTILIPVATSPSASTAETLLITFTRAVPPPETIPSSTAAL